MSETLQIEKYITDPVANNLIKLSNHFRRYHAAMNAIDLNRTVLDISCGKGYGSFLLAHHAHYVIGLDINSDYLKFAKKTFKKINLEFKNLNRFNEWTESYRSLVCIETIEHIEANKLERFVNKILDFDIDEAFISVPIGINSPNPVNIHHVNEPSIDVLYVLFEPHFIKLNFELFDYVNSYGQKAKECYLTLKERK